MRALQWQLIPGQTLVHSLRVKQRSQRLQNHSDEAADFYPSLKLARINMNPGAVAIREPHGVRRQ